MNRRRFLKTAVAAAATPTGNFIPLTDGQSVRIGAREFVLTDIIAPSSHSIFGGADAGANFALAALGRILASGAPASPPATARDRWGREMGPARWRLHDGRETTLQELLIGAGAARVAPESDDHDFIARCFAIEDRVRAAGVGLWSEADWRPRDAARAEKSSGYQIYSGVILKAAERGARVFLNFGEDFRTDFTASVRKGDFRRWKRKVETAALAGAAAEIRGYVEAINGPSIELLHEMQLRIAKA